MAITPLPTPPTRSDSANFATRGDAFMSALPTFVTEANATAAAMDTALQTSMLGVTATSTTSLTIGTGSKSLTVQTGKGFVVGMSLKIASTASPTNYMIGTVTGYTSGTGALVVNVDTVGGSGTIAAWTVSLATFESIETPDSSIGQSFVGENNSLKGWPGKNVLIASSQTWTVPDGVTRVRLYAFGAGGNGAAGVASVTHGGGGGGGGCAYGDVTVTSGDGLVIALGAGGSGTATTVTLNGTTLLDAHAGGNASTYNAGAASTGSSKHASVTNGGVYEGGAGGTVGVALTNYGGMGGGASGSPIGTGYAGYTGASSGGSGWGGAGSPNCGGGVGGASAYNSVRAANTTANLNPLQYACAGPGAGSGSTGTSGSTFPIPGAGRIATNAFADILLAPINGSGGYYETTTAGMAYVIYPGLGAGGMGYPGAVTIGVQTALLLHGNIGSGGGGGSNSHVAGTSFLGGGGGGGGNTTTNTVWLNGGAGGYGGGGGGGGSYSGSVGAGGAGGSGCVIIFW